MKCAVQIYMVLGGFHVYKSVFLGWVVGRFNIAVNGEHICGVLPTEAQRYTNSPCCGIGSAVDIKWLRGRIFGSAV